jgi:hypothetical protein
VGLLFLPAAVLTILIGVDSAGDATLLVARIAGAALVAMSVACWLGRNDRGSPAQIGLLFGVLTYDMAAAALLAYAGVVLSLDGIALWPAVALHTGLAVWCVVAVMRSNHKPKP